MEPSNASHDWGIHGPFFRTRKDFSTIAGQVNQAGLKRK
jgi:hypothetical protein